MQVSFIVTSYNLEAYIEQCLESLAYCTRAGDQIIIVDDGSRDDTVTKIKQALTSDIWPSDLEMTPVYLGTNTPGGVGIGANIGLTHVRREAAFFVDGDDWLSPQGMNAAREAFAGSKLDLLITNYRVFDEASQEAEWPSDARFWPEQAADLPKGGDAARDLALQMNAVPWRKFYRTSWLKAQGLRFPEGDFFYEDNPFHWACCLRAERIGFLDVCVANHRLNRVGQTMSDGGADFAAMFEHYETILADVSDLAPERLEQADLWLATNMSWQLERISTRAMPRYAQHAARALGAERTARWQLLCDEVLAEQEIAYLISALLQGGAHGLLQAWMPWQMLRRFEQHSQEVDRRLGQLENQGTEALPLVREGRDSALGARNLVEFLVLKGDAPA